MKPKTLLVSTLLISQALALSPYIDGYRQYIRYVKHIPKFGIKAPELLKKLNVKSDKELLDLFKNNAEPLIEKTKKFNPKAAEGLKKIIERGKLKQLEVFLISVFHGRIPAGCM